MNRFKEAFPVHGFIIATFSNIMKYLSEIVELEECIDSSQIFLPASTALMRADAKEKNKYSNLYLYVGKKASKITLGMPSLFLSFFSYIDVSHP